VNLFSNRFELDADGRISGFKLRIRGQKERIVSGLQSAGYAVAAMGDSMNDMSLLRECDFPVLYRPVDKLREAFPDAAVATDLDTALHLFEDARRRLDESRG
jgi:phosphoserine/homoserine phosphotransferase